MTLPAFPETEGALTEGRYLRRSLCQQLVLPISGLSIQSTSRTPSSIHHGSFSRRFLPARRGGEREVGDRGLSRIKFFITGRLSQRTFLEQILLHQGQAEPDPGDLGETQVRALIRETLAL